MARSGRSGERPLVFINNTMETFTPTVSGALATHIHECCLALARSGRRAWVVSRSADAAPFPWPHLLLIEPPRELGGHLGHLLTRAQRKSLGWPRQRQRAWSARVAATLEQEGLGAGLLVLQNDVETAVFLRQRLPQARILLLFQNQLPAKPRFRRRLGASVDVIAAVSDFTARWVEEHYRLPRDSVATVYSGVDSSAFRPPQRRAPGQVVIGFVGRTGIEKGADLLLEASLRLSRRTQAFAVQIVGSNHWDRFVPDAYQERLAGLVTQLRDNGIEVEQAGHIGRADLPAKLARSSIHVVPSRWDEPFGLTTLEGMAAGNAVVGSATGGTPEVIGNAGLLFPREDVDRLTELLHELVVDADAREDWGRLGRERAELMSWSATAERLLLLLERSS